MGTHRLLITIEAENMTEQDLANSLMATTLIPVDFYGRGGSATISKVEPAPIENTEGIGVTE